jgi:hypothetical protein
MIEIGIKMVTIVILMSSNDVINDGGDDDDDDDGDDDDVYKDSDVTSLLCVLIDFVCFQGIGCHQGRSYQTDSSRSQAALWWTITEISCKNRENV